MILPDGKCVVVATVNPVGVQPYVQVRRGSQFGHGSAVVGATSKHFHAVAYHCSYSLDLFLLQSRVRDASAGPSSGLCSSNAPHSRHQIRLEARMGFMHCVHAGRVASQAAVEFATWAFKSPEQRQREAQMQARVEAEVAAARRTALVSSVACTF